jgi:tetratricopeptide (TPR) repeat protein
MAVRRNAQRGGRLCPPPLLALLTLLVPLTLLASLTIARLVPTAGAAEFAAPPGVNAAAQEERLKERAMNAARDLLGESLVDVVAHVGYVRTASQTAGESQRIKLPGFNSFISAEGGTPQIVPQYARVRQVFVIVAEDEAINRDTVKGELLRMLSLKPSDGDWLELVTVNQPAKPAPAAKAENAMPENAMAGAAQPPPTPDTTAKPPPALAEDDPLKEPQSTAYLLRARTAYFAGDYHRALDEILQAIRIKPDNSQAYIMLGSIYYTMNWRSLALKYWDKALALDPGNREIADLVAELRVADRPAGP